LLDTASEATLGGHAVAAQRIGVFAAARPAVSSIRKEASWAVAKTALAHGTRRFGVPFRAEPAPAGNEALRRAEALGIPWERILAEEILAEQSLRRLVPDSAVEMPLTAATAALPLSFLKSWRVRDRIQSLSCEARSACSAAAIRELRLVSRRLIGAREREGRALAAHLWFAYQRILLLGRVCRAAARSRGTAAERVAEVCVKARCGFDDAAWAVCLEESPRHGHRLDAAVRKVRDEGFHVPRERTEARSFAALRNAVRRSPYVSAAAKGPAAVRLRASSHSRSARVVGAVRVPRANPESPIPLPGAWISRRL